MPTKAVLFLLITLFPLAVAADPAAVADPEPGVKIGIISAQTGPGAWWGRQIVHAVEMADSMKNSGHSVHFVYEDDAFSALNAVTAANKLIEQDHVQALLTFSGGPTAAVAEIAEARKVPFIGISAASAFTNGKTFAFRIFMSNDSQIEVLTRYLDAHSLKRVALVATTQESMLNFRNLFDVRNHASIVFNEEVPPTSDDMKLIATRIKRSNPEAAVFFINPPNLVPLTRALRDQRYSGAILGGVNMANPAEITASAGSMAGAVFPAPATLKTATFAADFTKRFGEAPGSEAFYAFDAVSLFIKGANDGNILETLKKQDAFEAAAGTYERKGLSFEVPAALWKITNSGFEPVAQ